MNKLLNSNRFGFPFFPKYFARRDDNDDEIFYRSPRYAAYIDSPARKVLEESYLKILPTGGKILDLMSSFYSYLPRNIVFEEVVGLGLNEAELEANSQLTEYVIHNLNREPILPFEEAYFDACILTLSVQYLIRPVEVFAEVARVLKPNAPFAIAFSDRMFPTKAVSIWRSANATERSKVIKSYLNYTRRFAIPNFQNLSPAPGIHDWIYVMSTFRSDKTPLLTRASLKFNYISRRLFLSTLGAIFAASIFAMKQVSTSDIENKVKGIIADKLGVDEQDIESKSKLVDDLGADSLDTVELIMAIEDEFDLDIPDDEAEELVTVGGLIAYIKEKKDDS